MSLTGADAYTALMAHLKMAATVDSCAAVIGWDERTYMPRGGAAFRGEQMALLAGLSHQKRTDPQIGDWLQTLESSELNTPGTAEAANLREIRRSYDISRKVPGKLVEELARVTTQAQGAWAEARSKDRFADFAPWLEKIVSLKQQEAQAIGYEEHPYDALFGIYEPGAKSNQVRQLFTKLALAIRPLLEQIQTSTKKPNKTILERDFPVEKQAWFAQAAAAACGFDFQRGRLDTTTHPFCTGIGPGDVRITTRYNPKFFNEAFFGVLHEAGHGIYEQGLPKDHFGTPLGSACSLGIHESQSRLWENQVGRSRAFWQHFLPRLQQSMPGTFDDVTLDDFLLAINQVNPSYIRVEADEVTYNLHIILRFELEQDLLQGSLKVSDLPGAWNERFEKMFGLTVPSDRLGCLQDIHWSMGGIGYFPTYTLGNVYSAQIMAAAKRDLPDLELQFAQGQFQPLKEWLNRSIHGHGQRYQPDELMQNLTGAGLNPQPFVDYLQEKMHQLYLS